MTTAVAETPVQTENPAADAAKATDDLIRELHDGTKTMDGISPDLRKNVMDKLSAEDSAPAADVAPAKVEDASPAKPAGEAVKPTEPSADEVKAKVEKAKAEQKLLADEANTYEQKVVAAKARRDKAKADLEAVSKEEIKAPDELFNEDSLANVYKENASNKRELAALKKMLMDRDDAEVTALETSHRTASEKLRFVEIDEVQAEFPALQLDESFEVANDKYARWIGEVQTASGLKEKEPNIDPAVLRTRAVEMWNSDPLFQAKIANKPPKDTEKLMVLLNAFNTKAAQGGTVMGHLLHDLKRRGVLNDMLQRTVQTAVTDAASRTVNALRKDAITPLGPGEGSTKGYLEASGITRDKAASTIKRINEKQRQGHNLSVDDKKQLAESMAFISGS